MKALNIKLTAGFLTGWLVFQCVYAFAVHTQSARQANKSVSEIEKRLSLDLSRLNLPNELLNHMGNRAAVESYIDQLNDKLAAMSAPVRIVTLEGVTSGSQAWIEGKEEFRTLVAPSREIHFSVRYLDVPLSRYFGFWPLLFAGLLTYLLYPHFSRRLQAVKAVARVESEPKPATLIVDLKNKTLAHSLGGEPVALANKPLCFYLALVDYCILHPERTLNQNKEVPPELIDLAHKYFHRLIELGHTIRKRPNFSNSLEKTLSEIRAALDEVLIDQPERKEIYYPPKAHGEGSRSRLHHYGLNKIDADSVEVIGK